MKRYQNIQLGFEITIPEEWSAPRSGEPRTALEQSLVFECQFFESFNIQVGPIKPEPDLSQTEDNFRAYAEHSGFTCLTFGRFTLAGKEQVWARYCLGNGKWIKKYLVVLQGTEYAMTAACFYQNKLLEREVVWDAVAASFHLLSAAQAPVELAQPAAKPAASFKPAEILQALKKCMLASSYANSQTGDPAQNIEQAIALLEEAVLVLNRRERPTEWAGIQIDLGEAYRKRLRGERPANLARAIMLYQQALEVLTLTNSPELWAAAHNNLGIAYQHGAPGDPAENLEHAIEHCQQALRVYTRQAAPDDWAMVQNNLGTAYQDRQRGDPAANLDLAIEHFQQALEVQAHQADRGQWAGTLYNLSMAYWNRTTGEREDNLEHMIRCCQQALEFYQRERYPRGWVELQRRLVMAFQARKRGDRAEFFKQALFHRQQILNFYPRRANPQQWAYENFMTGLLAFQFEWGDEVEKSGPAGSQLRYFTGLLMDRTRHEENIELAIFHFDQALQVYSRSTTPQDWAATHYWLGLAYDTRVRGSRADNIEQVIDHLQQALTVINRQANAEQWALTQVGLAAAYTQRVKGDRNKNYARAIELYQQALTVFTSREHPQEYAVVQGYLNAAERGRDPGAGAAATGLAWPDFYLKEVSQNPGDQHTLKLVHLIAPGEQPYQHNLLLLYQWQGAISEEEGRRLLLRAVAYLACAIYDAAVYAKLACWPSPVPHGRRPAWFFENEVVPIALTLSDLDLDSQTCQFSIGPVVHVATQAHSQGKHWKKLKTAFQEKFDKITV